MIHHREIPYRFVTNTTTHSRRQLAQRLGQAGVPINPDRLFTAPVAAAQYLRGLASARCYFCTSENIIEDFTGIDHIESAPTHLVVGDVSKRFTYEMMNRMFTMIQEGADIIALQKNRFWITKEGLKLDAGAFFAAPEHATDKNAKVFGKPSQEFFTQACASLRLPPKDVTMIGDDLRVDIEGAAAAGLMP